MSSTSDKNLARAIMQRHDDVRYTEALRFVGKLKEMRERNESRVALGAPPVVEVDPLDPAWKVEETARFFSVGARTDPVELRGVEAQRSTSVGLDEWHDVSGCREAYLSQFGEIQRAARRASGRARDEADRRRMRALLQYPQDHNDAFGPDGQPDPAEYRMAHFEAVLGSPGAWKSRWLAERLAEGPHLVLDPKTGGRSSSSDEDSDV